jgi:hypothetical protein
MKWIYALVLLLSCVLFNASDCFADTPMYTEDFSTTTMVDQSKTTAVIEPDDLNGGKPVLKLPRQSAAQALDFVGDGLVLADQAGVHWLEPNGSGLSEQFAYTDKTDGDIVGVLTIPNTQSVFAYTKDSVVRLDYDGSGVSKNPISPALGLEKVVSVSALEQDSGEPYVTVLGNHTDGSMVQQIYGWDGNTYIKLQEDALTGSPLAVTGGADLSYMVDYADHSTQYVQGTNGWSLNSNYTFSNPTPPLSIKGQGNDLISLDKDHIRWYNWTGSEHLLSQTLSQDITKGVTIAVHHDKQEYAYIDENGNLKYYQFDGSTMVENPSLEQSGINLNRRYFHPKVFQTKPLQTSDGKAYNVARLVVTSIDTTPFGVDKVSWEISTDNGSTWQPIQATKPGDPPIWTKLSPASSTWLLRGTLDTTNDIDTPRITSIQLFGTYMEVSNIQIQNVSGVSGSYPMSPPAIAKEGSEVAFTLDTRGVIGRADAIMTDANGTVIDTVPLTIKDSNQNDINTWAGKFVVPVGYSQTYSGDISITVQAYNDQITGSDLSVPVTYGPVPFLTFGGTLVQDLQLRLYK